MIFLDIYSEKDMENLGLTQAGLAVPGTVIFLSGELGAGKTTLVRGFLKGLGYKGPVTSPTYTLVESYTLNQISVIHFDLYRLKNLEELEMIGVRDIISTDIICFIEWPDRGIGLLPMPNYHIDIQYQGEWRKVEIS